jgi:hypothetical protein
LFDGVRRSGGQLVFAGEAQPNGFEGPEDRLRELLEASVVVPIASENGAGQEHRSGPGQEVADTWFLDREKVLLRWPYIEDLLVTELD